jgi:spore photoproduct lyase
MGELESVLLSQRGLIRFGTGEFTDSLLLRDAFSLYESLIPRIASTENAVLEIKTKTVNIEHLLRIGERKNIIVAWSLNSDEISRLEERNAPSIKERIDAAFEVQQHGYKVAFHFDPIIHYQRWERGYEKTIEGLFSKISPENTVYISMGTLRYIPAMKEMMHLQKVSYLGGDFVRGIDGKMRYFRPLRTKMYQTVLSFLRNYISEDKVYLCMESPEVWEDVFGLKDMNTERLTERLDRACAVRFAR